MVWTTRLQRHVVQARATASTSTLEGPSECPAWNSQMKMKNRTHRRAPLLAPRRTLTIRITWIHLENVSYPPIIYMWCCTTSRRDIGTSWTWSNHSMIITQLIDPGYLNVSMHWRISLTKYHHEYYTLYTLYNWRLFKS